MQLGACLTKRGIRPGAVVHQWSTSRGVHTGELSKKEFREAVIGLGLRMPPEEIDTVFDTFNEDQGGYLDADEAKAMIRDLRKVAEDAEHERFTRSLAAQRQRASATKKATVALAPLEEPTQQPKAAPGPAVVLLSRGARKGGKDNNSQAPDSKAKEREEEGKEEIGVALEADVTQRAAAREKKRQAAVTQRAKMVVRRMQRIQLTRAWNRWSEVAISAAYFQSIARRTMQRLSNPALHHGWNKWHEYVQQRLLGLHKLRMAFRHFADRQDLILLSCVVHEWRHAVQVSRVPNITVTRIETAASVRTPGDKGQAMSSGLSVLSEALQACLATITGQTPYRGMASARRWACCCSH